MLSRFKLFEIYGALRDRIAPGLRYSQHFYERHLAETVSPMLDWLDLGCGHRVLPDWRRSAEQEIVSRCRSVTGVDADLPALRKHRSIRRLVQGDITSLPFADASFDLVTANMVVEHLPCPETQFREVARVLRPGGMMLVHTPNALGYGTIMSRVVPGALKKIIIRVLDSRTSEDVFPAHYRANTRARLAGVAREAGLTLADTRMVATDALFAVVPPLAASGAKGRLRAKFRSRERAS